jgi:phosphohistidine swiveling domain-containing protein
MHKKVVGTLRILLNHDEATRYVETHLPDSPRILVTKEIDWTWTKILEPFEGVIADKGTRVSRGSEVLGIMGKPGVLGADDATSICRSGDRAEIVCRGNQALVYLLK